MTMSVRTESPSRVGPRETYRDFSGALAKGVRGPLDRREPEGGFVGEEESLW